ncbi:MAG: protein kinase domain-containing protein, partial [Planctomycetota bacterium]
MFVDLTTNEFVCRIVYFGPGLAGKSTNLTYLRDNAPSLRTTELKQADNEGERTLSFALYPVDVRPVAGLSCRVDVITNPGRSYYNSNRRALLQGADGIVFVADSRREAIDENIDSMNDLWSFLNHNRLGADIPLVVQYNKQDEDSALPVEQLDPLLNSQQKPSFGVAAVQGTNVIACFQAILAAVVATVATEENIRSEMTEAQQRGGSSESRLESILDPEEEDQSWLLTCYNCDAVLEVQSARRGDLFTCGSCSAILEVIEPSTGSTRAGQMPSSNHLVHHYEPESKRPTHTRADEDSALQPRDQDPRTRPLPSNDFHFQDPHSQSVIRHLGGALGSGAPGSSLSAPSELMPHMPGFEFQEEIDSSLLGTRYRTMEIDRQRSLRALVLSPMLLRQPGYRDQLEPHVRLAAKVRHPNLLPVLGVRWWNEIPVVFSEDVPGYEPLAAILARRRTLAPPQAMGIIRQLSLALEEAGRHGVVHGWLRPEVVLLNPSGNILLDDLAIPKNPGFLVRESMGGSASTEYHLAPEQLQGEITPDIRTDIFLLGALLFRMVTGEGLVTGYNAHEALHKLSTNGPRRMREVDPNVSREMDSFFLRMVAVDRQDRMQRHNELLQGLDKFGGGAKRNTLRAVRHPNTARVTRRGSAPGSGVRNTTAGRRSYSTLSGDDCRSRRSAGKKGSNPVLLVVLLLVLVGLVVAFVFRDRFGDPYRIREKDPATTTAERDDDRTGGRSGQEPDSTADELPTEPVALARALLTRYEATPDDDELEAELLDAIRALRVDQTTRRTGTVLYDRYRAIAEEHNLTKPQP